MRLLFYVWVLVVFVFVMGWVSGHLFELFSWGRFPGNDLWDCARREVGFVCCELHGFGGVWLCVFCGVIVFYYFVGMFPEVCLCKVYSTLMVFGDLFCVVLFVF